MHKGSARTNSEAMPKSATAPEGLPKKTFAIIFGVYLVTAMGNTGMISVLPAIVLYLLLQKFMIKGMMVGSIK